MIFDTWETDLQNGKQGEAEARAIFQRHGWTVSDMTDDWCYRARDIDFIATKGNLENTIEIKNSIATPKTGNLFIEMANINNKKHNGKGWYYYCEAAYYGFLYDHELHILSNDWLHNYIKTHSCTVMSTYDGVGILVPVADCDYEKVFN